ncbi:MAG: hypothetical protein U1E81_13865 [Xanthobacteraceae bacterium]
MKKAGTPQAEELVPDPQVVREFGITAMSLWRWDRDQTLIAAGWPPPIRIRARKFRSRRALEKFKEAMARRAIAERGRR